MNNYTAKEIQVLQDMEAVRKTPAMYIGDTDKNGLHHLVFEVIDNSVDEAMVGECKRIDVIIHQDESITVKDDGRGIPVDEHPTEKKSGVEVVLTTLHAGSKFSNKIYPISGGLHGVGISVVNALSEWLEVRVIRDKKVYYQRYEFGKPVCPLKIIKDDEDGRGTIITFKPDASIFRKVKFFEEIIAERLRELAFLNPGLLLTLKDERSNKLKEFQYEGGIVEFIKYLNKDKIAFHEPLYFNQEKDGVNVELAMQYTNFYTEEILSYANNINTREGGAHLTGFKAGVTKAILSYGKENNLFKNVEIIGDDTREGLTAIISVKLNKPQFEGQTKTKLGNSEVKGIVETLTHQYLLQFLEKNSKIAEKIIKKIITAAKARIAAQETKKAIREKYRVEQSPLPGKLAECSEHNERSELFIVEGESAGGTAKQARNRKFQAVLPIRGKILNVEKASEEKIFKSDEIKAIMKAVGMGKGEKVRYNKIIIMTDADVDGSHIRTLLLTLFFRYGKELIENNHIYIAQPPLYKVTIKGKTFYAYNEEEINKFKKDSQAIIQRFKGLGEMNPDELYSTTMNPETRTIKQVTIEDAIEAEKIFTILMGEKVEPRRKFIEENAKYVENLDI